MVSEDNNDSTSGDANGSIICTKMSVNAQKL
jgi:hypothetical protein